MARSVDSVRPAVTPPHTEDLYTGTLALRVHVVHVVMPGRPRQTFIYSRVYRYVYAAHLPVDGVCEPSFVESNNTNPYNGYSHFS